MNPSDEIKSKLDIVDVIREYIQLKAAGLNFRANCPFHREKTPSFMVSPEKQIWHCFGCGKGGDVFSFVMEIESLSFVETLRLLAKKAGVVLTKSDPVLSSKRNKLLDILELAAKYYHKVLMASPAAEIARKYLHERALTEETIEKWQIGYSPDTWDSLTHFLKSRGFNENEIFLAGLSVKKEKTPGFYDRFRGRIMFPIHDINGNVSGFTARVRPDKEAEEKMGLSTKVGKYINTPATMIYDKSKILFGLDKAKMAIKSEDAVILVEGQMDAITAEQNGFKNVIASSGTALTTEQVNLIKRYSNNLFLSFDMDKAGDLAAERGIAQAMQAEMNIKVIEISARGGSASGGKEFYKDPDECIKNNPDGWRRAVEEAKPMMQYYFDKTFAKLDLKAYEGQNQAQKILLPVIAKFGLKTEQDFWLKKLSQALDANENSLRERLKEVSQLAEDKQSASNYKTKVLTPEIKELKNLKPSRGQMLSELLLALVIKFPAHLEYVINSIGPENLVGEVNQLLYKNLIIYYNKLIDFWTREGGNFELAINYLSLKEWLSNSDNFVQDDSLKTDGQPDNYKCLSLLDRLVLLADKDFYDYDEEKVKAEIINIMANLRVNYLNNRRHEIGKLIAALEKENISGLASPAGGQEKNKKLEDLMGEFKTLTEEINSIEIK